MNELFEAFKKRYNQMHQACWTDTLSDAALATCWHQDQLREVVGHLKRPSPFYQRHLHAVDEHTLSLGSLASLDSIHFSLRPGQASPAQPEPQRHNRGIRRGSIVSGRSVSAAPNLPADSVSGSTTLPPHPVLQVILPPVDWPARF